MTERLGRHDLERAVELLVGGGTVAIPTETVYGLAADASSDPAVASIFSAKGRPAGHPLIVHVADASSVEPWATLADPRATALAERCWPGPLTLILPRTELVSPLVVGDRSTVGVRVPDHPLTSELLRRFAEVGSGGVAAPSANRFGHVSPTSADHVLADLDGRIDAVLDGGSSAVGVESTIVEVLPGQPLTLLRPGGVSVEQIEAATGESVVDGRSGESRAAGMMASHYAPSAPVSVVDDAAHGPEGATSVREAATDVDGDTVVIGPAGRRRFIDEPLAVLELPAEAAGFAADLYSALRSADALGARRIVVIPPTHGPLLPAVLDRLAKAASPRP